jgi:hypothetical protein
MIRAEVASSITKIEWRREGINNTADIRERSQLLLLLNALL